MFAWLSLRWSTNSPNSKSTIGYVESCRKRLATNGSRRCCRKVASSAKRLLSRWHFESCSRRLANQVRRPQHDEEKATKQHYDDRSHHIVEQSQSPEIGAERTATTLFVLHASRFACTPRGSCNEKARQTVAGFVSDVLLGLLTLAALR